jgi:hypothetical protein
MQLRYELLAFVIGGLLAGALAAWITYTYTQRPITQCTYTLPDLPGKFCQSTERGHIFYENGSYKIYIK